MNVLKIVLRLEKVNRKKKIQILRLFLIELQQ